MKVNSSRNFCTHFLVLLVISSKIVSLVNGKVEEKPYTAKSKNVCIILCRDCNFNSKRGVQELNKTEKEEEKKYHNCSVISDRWINLNTTWNKLNRDQILNLKLINTVQDLNRLNLQTFKNLQKITIKNTTTTSLHSRSFRQLPSLRELHIKRQNSIKFVDNGFLQNLTLEFLQIQGINLNHAQTLQFFRNLSGGLEIPKIQHVDWSHNNFENFTGDLLTPFPNLKVLILTHCNISTFGAETFAGVNLKSVYIDQNKVQRLPEKIFKPLVEKAELVSLNENHLICDCQLKWLQSIIKNNDSQKILINCRYPARTQLLDTEICPKNESLNTTPEGEFRQLGSGCDFINFEPILDEAYNKLAITKNEPELIEITISHRIPAEGVILWYGCYVNTTSPKFNCIKIQQQKFRIYVTPDANYLICLAIIQSNFHCFPFKTKPSHENQPWLTKKLMSVTIVCIFIIFLIAVATGAVIIYLLVRKNPSLIRGNKRVIEVKRHDKAKVLINAKQSDSASLMLLKQHLPLEPSKSSLSCDTISTVSYVSAHQPTQLEILAYRLNRLRQLYRREKNKLPPTVPRMSMPIAIPVNQRLPPDVDLLFEYEWYTITTTTNV